MTITLDPKHLLAASVFASTDATRRSINGVNIEILPDLETAIVSATDGKALWREKIPIESCNAHQCNFTVPLKFLKTSLIQGRKKDSSLSISLIDDTVSLAPGEGAVISYDSKKEALGPFPNTRQVIPRELVKAIAPKIAFDLYGRIEKCRNYLQEYRESGAVCYQGATAGKSSGKEPLVFMPWEKREVVIVIMSLSGGGENAPDIKATPSWATHDHTYKPLASDA